MSGSIYFKDDRKVLPQLERTSTYKDTESPVNIKNELGVNSMQPIIPKVLMSMPLMAIILLLLVIRKMRLSN